MFRDLFAAGAHSCRLKKTGYAHCYLMISTLNIRRRSSFRETGTTCLASTKDKNERQLSMNESWTRNKLVLNIVSQWVKPNYISTSRDYVGKSAEASLQHYFEKSWYRSGVDSFIPE